MLLVDLDGFKEVNDALGHAAGDELLCVMAKRFEQQLGDRGVPARLGGDEYAFACPVEREDDMVAIAHELFPVLSGPCVLDGVRARVGASIGVVASRPDGATTGELLRCADVASITGSSSCTTSPPSTCAPPPSTVVDEDLAGYVDHVLARYEFPHDRLLTSSRPRSSW